MAAAVPSAPSPCPVLHLPALQLRPYYQAEVIIGSVALGVLVAAAAWFALCVWRSVREERQW